MARFPVRRIWCVGSNYGKPDKDDTNREPPYFFSKQPDMAIAPGGVLAHPGHGRIAIEVELVLAIRREGRHVSEAQAEGLTFGHPVGLDMT